MKKRKKTAGKRKRAAGRLIQLACFSGVFLLIAILLLNFYSKKQTEIITTYTEKSLIQTAEKYVTSVQDKISELEEIVSLFSALLANDEYKKDNAMTEAALNALCEETNAYQVVVVNRLGEGVSNKGEKVTIGTEAFPIDQNDYKVQVTYAEDDGIKGEAVIVVGKSIDEGEKYILAYYRLEDITKHLIIREYDGKTWASVIDKNGKIYHTSGSNLTSLKCGKTMPDYVEQGGGDKKEFSRKLRRNRKFVEGIVLEDEETVLALVPLKLNNWYFAMGVTGSYVDGLIRNGLKTTNDFIRNFGMLIAAFFITIILMNLISRSISILRNESLKKKADTDLLTELNNKVATEEKIKEYMEENAGEQALLFVFDIDNFKKINDTRGHAFGDEVLRNIGIHLKSEFQGSDIIGRTGGDEFMIFLKGIKSNEKLAKECVKVAKLFENFQVGQYTKYSVTASIGCAVYPQDGEEFDELYKAADRGLYKAKQRGKNQLAFYNEENEEYIHKAACENVDNITNS